MSHAKHHEHKSQHLGQRYRQAHRGRADYTPLTKEDVWGAMWPVIRLLGTLGSIVSTAGILTYIGYILSPSAPARPPVVQQALPDATPTASVTGLTPTPRASTFGPAVGTRTRLSEANSEASSVVPPSPLCRRARRVPPLAPPLEATPAPDAPRPEHRGRFGKSSRPASCQAR
jgi:hypothetical protein